MENYDHKAVEPKWQANWERDDLYQATENTKKPKFYGLIEFPYPSGDGLHVGHIRSNTAMDIICRKRRAQGYEVLFPIGWDAFGLPAENYAIKTGIHPSIVTKTNTDNFRRQLKQLGFSFDWSREVNTTDPKYYKWTQWIFLQMFKNGLAYKKKSFINWCPKDLTGLANEEVIDGCCERCGTPVVQKEKEQWMLAITKYADRLDKDLDEVDFQEKIKIQQRNWIGRSEGSKIKFDLFVGEKKFTEKIEVFTTRIDTLFGVTYVVLSPEHHLVTNLLSQIANKKEIEKYIKITKDKKETERTDDTKEKTGVILEGVFAINPANGEKVPVWIADYVLADYGTGAVMAVPAHDERDWDFAKKYDLPVKEVITPVDGNGTMQGEHQKVLNHVYTGNGLLINSGIFDGKDSEIIRKAITDFVKGEWVTTYKLRDWVFSRQRYWGEPIPVVHCSKCGIVPVPEENLPVTLPEVENYKPSGNGESPLASIDTWVNVKCPQCDGAAKRETDTMPQWAGSSWYYIRYVDSQNDKMLAQDKNIKYWLPVDWYNGGMEHTTLHLLYSRFWHKFLYDIGVVNTKEPYQKRTSHGLILGSGGEKMSKSKGNVVNPDSIVDTVGADSLRIYEMFMGPFDQPIAWDTNNIAGSRRFLEKVWRIQYKVVDGFVDNNIDRNTNKTLIKVSNDVEGMSFNTAISAMMILVNEFDKAEKVSRENYSVLIKILSPFAPYITEEIWHKMGNKDSVHISDWPKERAFKDVDENIKIVIQINGKLRGHIETIKGQSKEVITKRALELPEIVKWIDGKNIKQTIFVPDRLINIVVG
jgi:leucyl-tRNA synthetase